MTRGRASKLLVHARPCAQEIRNLFGTPIQASERSFNYTVVLGPGGSVYQRGSSGNRYLLGSYRGWNEDVRQASFTNGDSCGSVARSVRVIPRYSAVRNVTVTESSECMHGMAAESACMGHASVHTHASMHAML